MDPSSDPLREIFFPDAQTRMLRAQRLGTRFVHYTSAAVAASIIQRSQFWMRKTSTMGDFEEVNHGLSALAYALKGEAGDRLRAAVEEIYPDIYDAMRLQFAEWAPHFLHNTYVGCFSEHDSTEDQFGRLSMWRAYGGTCGVALVLNPAVFFSDSDALKVFSSPVAYMDETGVDGLLRTVAENIRSRSSDLRVIPAEVFAGYLFTLFRITALCTKHLGFREEREWRAIYNPSLEASPRMAIDVEVVRGVPQPIAKVTLQNHPEDGMIGLAIPEFINRVIIGPTEYPSATREAFINLLLSAGVTNADSKVVVSNIPLRSTAG